MCQRRRYELLTSDVSATQRRGELNLLFREHCCGLSPRLVTIYSVGSESVKYFSEVFVAAVNRQRLASSQYCLLTFPVRVDCQEACAPPPSILGTPTTYERLTENGSTDLPNKGFSGIIAESAIRSMWRE